MDEAARAGAGARRADEPVDGVSFDARFRGPPASGNGGYCGGVFAERIAGPAEVTFRRPIPLDSQLRYVSRSPAGFDVMHGDALIAEVVPHPFDLDVPPPPGRDEAAAASDRYLGHGAGQFFSGCFGCGVERREADGLRVFAGPCGHGRVATPWTPHPVFARPDGTVGLPVLWSALDCPGGFVIMGDVTPGRLTVTGKLAVRVDHPVHAGEEYIVSAWLIEKGARKHVTGAALFDRGGRACAVARAVWLEPKSA